ncbi:hypothetical protein GCM10027403_07810 [Arthrobacter tecti]
MAKRKTPDNCPVTVRVACYLWLVAAVAVPVALTSAIVWATFSGAADTQLGVLILLAFVVVILSMVAIGFILSMRDGDDTSRIYIASSTAISLGSFIDTPLPIALGIVGYFLLASALMFVPPSQAYFRRNAEVKVSQDDGHSQD